MSKKQCSTAMHQKHLGSQSKCLYLGSEALVQAPGQAPNMLVFKGVCIKTDTLPHQDPWLH